MELLTRDELIDKEMESGIFFGPYHRQRVMETAPWRVRKHMLLAEKARAAGFVPMAARQTFASMDVNDFPPASFAAVTATATETNLWTQQIWTPIPANDMRAGKVYKISFGGIFSTTATPGTNTFFPRIGTSATPSSNLGLGSSGGIAGTASQTTQPWYGEFTMGVRAIGVAAGGATVTGNGFAMTSGGTSTGVVYPMGGSIQSAVDQTILQALIVSLSISVASQSYTCQWAVIRSYN